MNQFSDEMSVGEAAKMLGVTPAAVYLMIRKNKLPNSKKINESIVSWRIVRRDLDAYIKNKYSRSSHYDPSKGEISVNEAAEILNLPKMIVYYLIRKNYLKFDRKNWSYILFRDDVEDFKAKRNGDFKDV